MILKDIRNIYHSELDALFGKEEVDSFFNVLIEHYLNLKRIHLVLDPQYMITKEEEQPLFEALTHLKSQKPIQYILGETEFYGLPFKVNEHTLIPRPETEELVDWIINCHTERSQIVSKEPQTKILDIGTGTGCIAISLAKHLLNTKVSALDVSEEALVIAQQNAELNVVNVEFIHDDILNSRQTELVSVFHKYDVIVSNPPYVRNLEKAEIQPNVLDNEPHLALFVDDENPLQFYKAICEFAQINLKANGMLYFEINEYLGAEMIALLEGYGFKNIELKKDLYGKDRMVKGVK
ncbi:peptide chain release factor N(5)-glutamine methyltransferase [Psychroserpens burtonensis]|uniref:Release factor glutamine methyltransferase n=1 Tax=Psychroserpens burtonensis TaxID=49278 RepID=A0A5C7BFU5_9FLAO|nr:peptide chain release factor N(5)-glutamine methyltransferase [Psychroserpens burtonensis]TXE17436.1 peptide chain release factor N(5)-glutamine methyltransferase [Psychroserpens burtonensis]